MYIRWIFLFLTCKTIAEQAGSDSTNGGGIFQVEVSTKNIGRIKYQDGEVLIAQNQQKNTDFFFPPFPYLQPLESDCHENQFDDRIELRLHVELYTPQLIEAVKEYLFKYQSAVCGNTTSSFVCDVSLVPMNSIRLVKKGSRSDSIHQKYTLEDNWQSATLLLQSMGFIIYTLNMSVCEQLLSSLNEKCRLPNFEIHYSLHGQQTVQRQLEVNTEHLTNTNMYNQIRSQFSSAETVVLTGNDFKKLLSESTDQITMTLRQQEGFENLQDPIDIDKLLEQKLFTQQIQLQLINDKLWENLYWNSELTRPDRLAKVLNSIVRKDSGGSERFIYDRQAAKDAMKLDLTQHDTYQTDLIKHDISGVDQSRHDVDRTDLHQHDIDHFNSLKQSGDRAHLTHHDKQRFQRFDKLFDAHSQASSSSNSRSSSDDANGEFELFGLFKLGGGGSGSSHSQSESSDNRADISDKQHGRFSDADTLNVTQVDKHNLNVHGIGRNHLNITRIDKERSNNIRTNTNNFNQAGINTNNFNATKIDKDTDKQYAFSRSGVEKFLREFSNNVHLEGDIIKPRPIDARLVKIGKLSTKMKLSSNTVLVRMRTNVHALPLRCKPGDNGGKLKVWLSDRVDQIETILLNLNNHSEITKLYDEIKNVKDKISVVENKTENTITKSNREMDTASNRINVEINNLETSLTNRINQNINNLDTKLTNRMNQNINDLDTSLTNRMNQNINNLDTSLTNRMTLKIDNLVKNLTDIKQDINALSSRTNGRIDNLNASLANRLDQTFSSIRQHTYSSLLTIYDSTYQRPGRTEQNYYYHAIRIHVLWSGTYNISCNSSIDTYGYLYNENFYRTSPSMHLITSNDDDNGSNQFKLNVNLQMGTKYILVVTTYHAGVTGAFTVYTAVGVSFSKIYE